jgi:hypothetical protein
MSDNGEKINKKKKQKFNFVNISGIYGRIYKKFIKQEL